MRGSFSTASLPSRTGCPTAAANALSPTDPMMPTPTRCVNRSDGRPGRPNRRRDPGSCAVAREGRRAPSTASASSRAAPSPPARTTSIVSGVGGSRQLWVSRRPRWSPLPLRRPRPPRRAARATTGPATPPSDPSSSRSAEAGSSLRPSASAARPAPPRRRSGSGSAGTRAARTRSSRSGPRPTATATGCPTTTRGTSSGRPAAHDLDLDILPGDRIAARVELARSSVRVSIDDLTGGQRFTKTLPLRRPDGSSVEWIAEAPAVTVRRADQIVPLTNFGTVRFSGASAISRVGAHGSISDPAWHESAIDFLSDRGNPRNPILSFVDGVAAAHGFPSDLRRGGTAFSITWRRGLTVPPRGSAPRGAA